MQRTIHYHYTRPGRESGTYQHRLVADEPDVKVMLMDHYQGRPLVIDGVTVAAAGSPLLWFVFPGRWHDIGRFHLPDGTFTGWYTNLCTPIEIFGPSWSSTDLFLDHWTSVDGWEKWLDEDELAAAIQLGLVSDAWQREIVREREMIQAELDGGRWPPDVALTMDLESARWLTSS